MPNEAIERAAQAAYEAQGLQAGLNPPWTSLNAPQREPYLREARAAISAYFADVPVSEAMKRIIEFRARKICQQYGENPDEVTDDYGPVLKWHSPAYHISEAVDHCLQKHAEELSNGR